MFQAGYYNGNTMLKLISFGGKAKTGLTYTGATKEEMRLNGRRFHTEGMYYTSNGPHSYYYMKDGERQRATVDYYDDQTDNYLQINNQLVLSHRFNEKWTLNATGFYTYGYGFYKQYKDARTLSEYLNIPADVAAGKEADLVREKIMRNHLGGLNASAAYSVRNLDLAFGGSYSYYSCPHWGVLDWVDGLEGSQIGSRWYDNDVDKHDANLFARANWSVAKGLRLFADLQYRYVSYQAWGVNDNYVSEEVGMQPIDVDKQYHFFNPRAGVSYTLAERNNFYLSFAVAQKEPTRSDFTDRRGRRHLPLVGKALRLGAGLPVHGAAPLAGGESLLHEVQGPARADGHGERRQQRPQHQRPGQLPPGRGAVGLVARNRVVHRGGQRHLLAEPHRELRRRTEG